MSKRWLSSGYLKAKPQEVDKENGVIKGVKVCSEGEAQGHGMHLEAEFIDTVVEQGGKAKNGLKARFGHPNMCNESLGTFIGRFKNFTRGTTIRDDGTEAACCFADLHLSDTAKDTPNGDLHSYVLAMAENENDMFGTSIVFTQGKPYRRDKDTGEKAYRRVRESFYEVDVWYEKEDGTRLSEEGKANLTDELFVECEKLHACDCVDDPAANDGLFSAFSGETVAGQITEFLDLHPQVFEALQDNQEVMKALANYGGKIDEFMSRYAAYKHGEQPDESQTIEVKAMGKEQKKAEVETLETEEAPETVEVAEEKLSAEDVKTLLAADRRRQREIRELGTKFGFEKAAEEFADSDRGVDEFRTHILNKSPEDWKASLSVKNPTYQQSEQEVDSLQEGADAVAKIKERRKEKFGA